MTNAPELVALGDRSSASLSLVASSPRRQAFLSVSSIIKCARLFRERCTTVWDDEHFFSMRTLNVTRRAFGAHLSSAPKTVTIQVPEVQLPWRRRFASDPAQSYSATSPCLQRKSFVGAVHLSNLHSWKGEYIGMVDTMSMFYPRLHLFWSKVVVLLSWYRPLSCLLCKFPYHSVR